MKKGKRKRLYLADGGEYRVHDTNGKDYGRVFFDQRAMVFRTSSVSRSALTMDQVSTVAPHKGNYNYDIDDCYLATAKQRAETNRRVVDGRRAHG